MTAGRRALVVGASSGIGAALLSELSSRGYATAGVARRETELAAAADAAFAKAYVHDVRNLDEVPGLFSRIRGDLGGLDLIVYCAGAMPKITPDTWDTGKDEEVVRTNLLGAIAWMNEAAAFMKAQGKGSIVGISSIAGDRGRRGYPAYCASKAALNTYLESLRNRLSRHGVSVTTIKPGYVDTAMTKGMDKLFWMASPEKAARAVVDAAESRAHTRYVLRRWALVGLVIRSIPSFLFRRLDI